MEEGEVEVAGTSAPLRFPGQAVTLLAASLDLESTLANVLRLAVPGLADWCAIDLIQPDGTVRPIAGEHADPHRQELLAELQEHYGAQRVGAMARVLRTGRAELHAEVTDAMLAGSAHDARHLELLRAVDASGFMVVPLRARDHAVGTMVLLCTDPARRYDEDDLAAAEELAAACALAVDNARLYGAAREAERRTSFLADASALLDQSLDVEVTLRNLGAIAVPALADWFAVDLIESDQSLRRAAVAHSDPARVTLGWELARRFPAALEDEAGLGRTIRTGCSELLVEVPDRVLDRVAGGRAEYATALRSLGLTSAMIVPLRARGRILGAMLLAGAESGRHFGASDFALAEELGVRCALALDNARLYQERSETARTLQSSLLPPSLPSIDGLELAARYRAAGEGNEVGGDFYDMFAWDDGWAVALGDVCGKGPRAAAITALARYTLRAVSMHERLPSATLRTLNDAMLRQLEGDQFCTVALGRLDREHAGGFRLRLSVGGHPPPLVLRVSGRVEALAAEGTLLGVVEQPSLADAEHVLEAGDTLLLYTDGVTEARVRSRELGEEGLASLLEGSAGAGPAEIVERIERAVVSVQAGAPRDDIALVAVRVS